MYSAVLIAVPAILFGGCMMTKLIFAFSYPALRDTLVIPIRAADLLSAGGIVLLLTTLLSAGIAAIGRRLQKRLSMPSGK
jgi:hypothetical protein